MIFRHHNNHLRHSFFPMIISDSVMDAIYTASMKFTLQAPSWTANKCFYFLWIRINQSNKYDIEWCPVPQIIQLEDTYAVMGVDTARNYLVMG